MSKTLTCPYAKMVPLYPDKTLKWEKEVNYHSTMINDTKSHWFIDSIVIYCHARDMTILF